MIHISAFSGSLRKKSFNTVLLKTVKNLVPEDVSMTIIDLGTLPLYNEDLISDTIPKPVTVFRLAIEQTDGILIASPEYNYSMTGVLKNALDWAATDSIRNILKGKPTAIMGASKSIFGTVRAQLHLRQVLAAANADVINRPEVFIPRAQNVILEEERIEDDRTIFKLQALITILIDKIRAKK